MDEKQTILIVDDEANVLKALKRLLFDTDYRVLTAPSGEEALALFEKNEIDLIISDYRMPGMNGVQLLSSVKERFPETIRIILSGYADVESIVEAINDGHVYKFLAKPWNDQELLTTIQRSFEHHTLQQENLQLLYELRRANTELTALARSLEGKVEERTRDLAQKNRALEVARKILNLLPHGVVGVDSEGLIVYVNQATRMFLGADACGLGAPLSGTTDAQIVEFVQRTVSSGKQCERIIHLDQPVEVVCTPLPEGTGAILCLSYPFDESDPDSEASDPISKEVSGA
jgi:two-component system NtrC family sensor kinase